MPRAFVTGGAGFVGSHLCERLLRDGWHVVCVDSFLTGDAANIDHLQRPEFTLVQHDITEPIDTKASVDVVFHLASPASPADYLRLPIETLRAGAVGTLETLRFAMTKRAVFLLASTSETYGDPLVHPQPETYWGNVNPIGPRSVYDEAKRFAEAATMAFHRRFAAPVRIARIFNTYGPRMRRNDGRAVPTFIEQAISGEPLTIHGDGKQTRSLCYVDDLIDGLLRLAASTEVGPVNLGNPAEITVEQLAIAIRDAAGSTSEIVHVDRPTDDPQVRQPDISLARRVLDWEPRIDLGEGLQRTIRWSRENWT